MIKEIIVPKMGANMDHGIIGRWFRKEGDKIEKGDPLFELETDKAVFEVESEYSGTLKKISLEGGKEAPVLAVVGLIEVK
ncbi:lipoyl domain-containing protein [Candidatus Woesearchaeota archaeon]|nr:lipoyl domain-containing protein [Candidatus Woesearchaeota archaeon]